jgi:CrcB protein
MKLLLLASLGGAIGAGARYLVNQAFAGPGLARGAVGFPWATITVNVVGSFLMGVVLVAVAQRFGGDPAVRTFLATGILGGLTTFSAFSFEAVELALHREPTIAAAYVLGSVALSIAAFVAGSALARGWFA